MPEAARHPAVFYRNCDAAMNPGNNSIRKAMRGNGLRKRLAGPCAG